MHRAKLDASFVLGSHFDEHHSGDQESRPVLEYVLGERLFNVSKLGLYLSRRWPRHTNMEHTTIQTRFDALSYVR